MKNDPIAFTHERYGKTLRDLAANDGDRMRGTMPRDESKTLTRDVWQTMAVRLAKDVARHQDLAACMYQFAGAHNAPVRWLDVLIAASNGRRFSTRDLLPYVPEDDSNGAS